MKFQNRHYATRCVPLVFLGNFSEIFEPTGKIHLFARSLKISLYFALVFCTALTYLWY